MQAVLSGWLFPSVFHFSWILARRVLKSAIGTADQLPRLDREGSLFLQSQAEWPGQAVSDRRTAHIPLCLVRSRGEVKRWQQ